MRVLLVSLNNELLPEPAFPLGLAIIAGSLRHTEHEYELVDLCFQSPAELMKTAKSFNPAAVGLSLRNIDNVAYPDTTTYLPYYKEVVAGLREVIDCPFILGGPGYSLFPRELLDLLRGDYGIKGSGETLFPQLLDSLEQGREPVDVENLYVRKGDIRRHGEFRLDTMQTCPDHSRFDLRAYHEAGGMINVQTKRGCPFSCIYCSYPVLEGRVQLTRPVPEVMSELAGLCDRGVGEVYFVDSVFNHPVLYAKKVCRALIKARLPLKWTCYAAPYLFDQEIADLCVESGCMGIELGTDCLSPVMLKSMGKVFTVDDVQATSRHCHQAGLPFCHDLLLGGPGETWGTVRETVENAAGTDPTAAIVMTGLRIIPGTKLYDISLREGVISTDTNMLEPRFYLSHHLTNLSLEINRLSREFKTWIFPGHSIRCSVPLAEHLRKRNVRGPLWLHMSKKSL